MRVVMVSPHLPPDQAANALLPVTLATELKKSGVEATLAGHRPTAAGRADAMGRRAWALRGPARRAGSCTTPGLESGTDTDYPARALDADAAPAASGLEGLNAVVVPRRGRSRLARTPVGAAVAAVRVAVRLYGLIERADLVHLHSNGLIVEVAARLAERSGVPFVITLYGTDVWHHDPGRHKRFGEVVRAAAHRVFYSEGLLAFARSVDLAKEPASVIYAPVAPHFEPASEEERRATRSAVGLDEGPLLVTVKRLHPVAGHEDLLHAMRRVVSAFPAAHLLVIGDGPLRSSLERLAAQLDLGGRVHFLGAVVNELLPRYLSAADLFVLPSRLESWGTVMLEALACGTPVVATPTAGALEVVTYFPHDVRVAEGRDAAALAAAVVASLEAPRRTTEETRRRLRERFSPAACAAQYLAVYHRAVTSPARQPSGS